MKVEPLFGEKAKFVLLCSSVFSVKHFHTKTFILSISSLHCAVIFVICVWSCCEK